MKYAIIDVETTGLAGSNNKVTEIAVAIHDGARVIDEFHTLVNPLIPIAPYVVGLTGIDDGMVQDAPVFDAIADQLLQLTEDCVFVAHNVSFDYSVIQKEFKSIGVNYQRKKLCTVRLSRKIFPGLKSYSLGKLCSYLDIKLNNRHRAKGDTDATVILFEKLLRNDSQNLISGQLNFRSGEAALPSLLSKETVDKLPSKPGVYYFKDSNGVVIYVGKAIHIKKRVLSHFYDKKENEMALCRETATIDFEESGSELLALLMESVAIKKYFPKFNRAQKLSNRGYAILSYTNRLGIIQLGYNKTKLVPKPLAIFYKVSDCIAFLENLCERFDLCPKYTQLLPASKSGSGCDHFKLHNCRGICKGEESVGHYNQRVKEALETSKVLADNFVLVGPGRSSEEKGIVWVENGIYRGYGFVESSIQISVYDEFMDYIQLQKNDNDSYSIVQQFLTKGKNYEIIRP
ncbi:exonuclease domain-containing protein [Galbibacter sp.]|uniref:exonuclease domain-containing protein n=1 Tax=Galbibacter sp. TaxID=2918471 RepID=UPI003A8D7328